MEKLIHFFGELYQNFNNRRIDLVISNLTEDVKWANGMDGGYVNGHKQLKEYWTRQFNLVNSNVRPLEIKNQQDKIVIKVHQIVHDLEGNLLSDEDYFYLTNSKISAFHINEKR